MKKSFLIVVSGTSKYKKVRLSHFMLYICICNVSHLIALPYKVRTFPFLNSNQLIQSVCSFFELNIRNILSKWRHMRTKT